VRTVPVSGESDAVDTWTNTVSSEDGTPDSQQNLCCSASSVTHAITGETLTSSEYILKTGEGTTQCTEDDTFQTKIRPFPSFSKVTVTNPLSPMTVWAALGGAYAVFDLLGGGLAGLLPRDKMPNVPVGGNTLGTKQTLALVVGSGDVEL